MSWGARAPGKPRPQAGAPSPARALLSRPASTCGPWRHPTRRLRALRFSPAPLRPPLSCAPTQQVTPLGLLPASGFSRALSYFSSLDSKYVRTCKRPFPSTVAASETLRPGSSSASWPRGLTEAPHGCGGLFRRGEGRGFPQRSGGAHSARPDSARGQREGPRASRLAPDLAPDVRSGCHSSPSPSGAEPPSARRVATEGKGPGRHHQSLLDFASAK